MTDDEFQSLMDGRSRMEVDTAEMAEGPNLASGAVGRGEKSGELMEAEGVTPQSEREARETQAEEGATPQSEAREGENDKQTEEDVTPHSEAGESEKETEKEGTEVPSVPPVSKPRVVKRKLVLKSDPKAERPKPQRVSQRCLGRWTSSKAGSNKAVDAVEISSEEEKGTPTKLEEESSTATDQGNASAPTDMVSPALDDQKEETTEMAEGPDLASRVAKMNLPIDDDTIVWLITKPTAQKEPSTSEGNKPEKDEEKDRYLQERKRKGKAPVTKKQSNKKQRTVNTSVVIREPEQNTQPRQQQQRDSEYSSSEESESESDVTLEDEFYHDQELPNNHRKLVHPQVERLVYRKWRVVLTDELMEDMNHYNT